MRAVLIGVALLLLAACGEETKICPEPAIPQVCVSATAKCCASTSNVPYCRDGTWTCPPGQLLGTCQAFGGSLPKCGPAPDASGGNH